MFIVEMEEAKKFFENLVHRSLLLAYLYNS